MTPKEKAKELVNRFKKHAKENRTSLGATPGKFKNIHHPSQCALIAVDEILKLAEVIDKSFSWFPSEEGDITYIQYWEEVKQEIEKL